MRAAHLRAVQAGLIDHVARLEWSRGQIEQYQGHRLQALLAYAKERSPFHSRRLRQFDPVQATVADLASLPVMTKQDAQQNWDTIVTAPDLDRDRAERILAEQQWFSYNGEYQIFSSGGSSGVRGVYVWDWDFYISAACLAWRMQARDERRVPSQAQPARGVLRWRSPARQHPAVRRADRPGHADPSDRGRRSFRRGAGRGRGGPAHAPGGLSDGDRATGPRGDRR